MIKNGKHSLSAKQKSDSLIFVDLLLIKVHDSSETITFYTFN